MKSRLLLLTALIALLLPDFIYAQTVDTSFQPTALYRPAHTYCVAQQADGKYLIVGDFCKTDIGSVGPLVRFNADFTPDITFNSTVAGLTGTVYSVRIMSTGKLLVVGEKTLTLSGVVRQDLMQLNADGTPDPSFDAGTASTVGTGSVVEPLTNGQILVGGTFTSYNGVVRNRLVRLNATGGVDNSFVPPVISTTVTRLVIQPDTKVLVASQNRLQRLNANGSVDNSFTPVVAQSTFALALQPDGRILLGGSAGAIPANRLMRLLSDGTPDNTFNAAVSLWPYPFYDGRLVILQPDGRILIYHGQDETIVRLNSDGSRDVTFQGALIKGGASWLTLTNSGQLFVAGSNFDLPGRRSQVVLLETNGSLNRSFSPTLLAYGYIESVVVQADGSIIVGGVFDECNGILKRSLVRLLNDGTLDVSFSPPSSLDVRQLVLQPDGKLLVGQYKATNYPALIRLLPTGALDASFSLEPSVTDLSQVLLQPDGRIIALVGLTGRSNILPVRILANGRLDQTFTTAFNSNYEYIEQAALQPDGKLLLAGSIVPGGIAANAQALTRLMPNGQVDPSFTPVSATDAPDIGNINLQPDGKVLVVDNYYTRLRRFSSTGLLDPTFVSYIPAALSEIYTVQIQPNGRVLVAGSPSFFARLLPDGTPDALFTAPSFDGVIYDIKTTAAGQLVLGGFFHRVNGLPRTGLVRLNANNVLHLSDEQSKVTTQAYPNPAHDQLTVALDATAKPQRVTLIDMLGKTMLTQPVGSQTQMQLPVRQLHNGVYILRVEYATGPVTQRVVVE